MLNRPWIDPRSIDWTDPLNGLRPGWNRNNNPYVFAALADPIYQALRQAKGIESRIYVCPEPAAQLIQPGATYDYEVPSEPNCWLWAIGANGQLGDGTPGRDFLLNITDSVTGAKIFSQPVSMNTISPARNGTAGRGVQFFLSTPHLFAPPSYPVVRLINTLGVAQSCRVTLWTCVEYDV